MFEKNHGNQFFDYHGYKVYPETGVITTRNGKVINLAGSEQVHLTIDGDRVNIKRARVIYEAATGIKTQPGDVFVYRDGNKLNAAFSNIKVYNRKDYFKKLREEEKERVVCKLKKGNTLSPHFAV